MTNLLLDTDAFIWYAENDSKLPKSIEVEIETADRVYISIASLWQIEIKLSIRKLSLRSNYESIGDSLKSARISLISLSQLRSNYRV